MAVGTRRTMQSVNPATEEVMAQYPLLSPDQIDRALDRARRTFPSWRDAGFDNRAKLFRRLSETLRAEKTQLAGLITDEMGKPIVQSEAEVEKCAWNCDYFAEHAAAFLNDQPHPSSATESYVTFEPLGTVLAVMPWNFPFWQVFRFAAPALMAGNTAVLKHASNVPQCSLEIERVFERSGFPRGVFQSLLITGSTADEIIGDPRINAVTLTGSTETGQHVAGAAGRHTKKSVLELGGSDPVIVLEDADLDQAVDVSVRSRFRNTGQACDAAKRFILVNGIAEAFTRKLLAAVSALKVGPPRDRMTEVGPLARRDLVDTVDRQVQATARAGARLLVGGYRLQGRGFFYAPTVLDEVRPDMVAGQEEVFGPAIAIFRVRNVEEAITLANDSRYGLGADLWTQDLDRAKKLARRIVAGTVYINGTVASDPRLPFGGVKESGFGRELSEYGIREFTNIQSIFVGPMTMPQPTHLVE